MNSLIIHANCLVCPADDITMSADGVDCYHLVKAAGRYK